MTCELMLLRHGKSDWSVLATDFERPLTKRGKRGAKAVGHWLHDCSGVPDYIITSPAKRARATARRAARNMGFDVGYIVRDERIYEAGTKELLAVLRDCPVDAKRVMLVGHNPGFEDMVRYLANTDVPTPANGKLLPTATLAWFSLECAWKDVDVGCASLISITRPGV